MDQNEAILAAIPGAAPAAPEKADPLAEQKAAFAALTAAKKSEKSDEEAALDAKKAVAATKKPKRDKAEAAPKEAAPAEPAKPKDKESERLRAKLVLAGAPKAAVENLTDESVREWWQVQEEREQARALALERASAAEKKLAAIEGTTSKPAEPKGVPTAELDLDDIAAELADQFGEEDSGTLLKALKAVTEPLLRRVGELEGVINDARKRGVEDISSKNRQRLAAKLPSLKDNDRAWTLIHGEVEKAFKESPTKFASVEAAFDDAFEAIYGAVTALPAAEPEPDDTEAKARITASSPTPPSTRKQDKKLSPMEGAWNAFKVLQRDAEDVDGARKAFARGVVQ